MRYLVLFIVFCKQGLHLAARVLFRTLSELLMKTFQIPYYFCRPFWLICLLAGVGFSGCRNFKQAVLFTTPTSINAEVFEQKVAAAGKNYTIAPHDYIAVTIYTNKGERLIDPNAEFEIGTNPQQMQNAGGMNPMMMGGDNTNTIMNYPIIRNSNPPGTYMVDAQGTTFLPMVGEVNLQGLTLRQADSLLSIRYAQYYEEPFVVVQYLNKRVILMGAMGEKVIPLRNENMTLIEVLAIAGNLQINSKANNIRIVRGDLRNPSVQVVDLTTIEGVKAANMILEPNDIIYVEPRRVMRSDEQREIISYFTTGLTTLTTILALVLTINNLTK